MTVSAGAANGSVGRLSQSSTTTAGTDEGSRDNCSDNGRMASDVTTMSVRPGQTALAGQTDDELMTRQRHSMLAISSVGGSTVVDDDDAVAAGSGASTTRTVTFYAKD